MENGFGSRQFRIYVRTMMAKSCVLLICISFAILPLGILMSVSGIEEPTVPVFVEIADYYDNRQAVVTVTLDDWVEAKWESFEDACEMLTSKEIYFTGGVITDLSANWTQIQYWLDEGFAEAASHSSSHPNSVTFSNYDYEIGDSRQEIMDNLDLPDVYSFGGNEYVYSWIEPYGTSDEAARQKLGEYNYLVDRKVESDFDLWADWNSSDGLFDRTGYSIRMEWDYNPDEDILNSKFDEVYASGEIYHLFFHPSDANLNSGEYADLHTTYISGKKDVWYVPFGLLYLYHFIDNQNLVEINYNSEENAFHLSIDSNVRQNYGTKYPITYVFDIPQSWTNASLNYRFQETNPWTKMEIKTSSDFFNGINAVRYDFQNHKAYVSIAFSDTSNDIHLQILREPPVQPPVAVTGGPYTGTEGETIIFDGSQSYDPDGNDVSFFWNFGDGSTSTERNPNYVYEHNGSYIVTLTVIDNDLFNDTATTTVTVVDKNPIPDFSASPTIGSEPLQVHFTDSSSSYDGIISWIWDFGDGYSSTDQNPTHIYENDESYTVALTVVESDGDSTMKKKEGLINVTDTKPLANFKESNNPTGLTLSFIDTSIANDEIVSWFWDFGDSQTSTEQNPIHEFPDYSTFNVSLTVTDEDASIDTITQQVSIVNLVPTADFQIVSSPKPTADEDISFLDQSSDPDGDIVFWFWEFGDGTNSTAQNVTHRYFVVGEYAVNLTVKDDGGKTTKISKELTIYDVSPPVTVDDYNELEHTSDFTIKLNATDDFSGLQNTYYILNDGATMNVQTHGQPQISVEGDNKLEYWSVDNAGNEETHRIIQNIKLNKNSYQQTVLIIGGITTAIGTSIVGIIFYTRKKRKKLGS